MSTSKSEGPLFDMTRASVISWGAGFYIREGRCRVTDNLVKARQIRTDHPGAIGALITQQKRIGAVFLFLTQPRIVTTERLRHALQRSARFYGLHAHPFPMRLSKPFMPWGLTREA